MEQSIIDTIIKVIQQLGFPIFVAVWLLIRTDKIMRELKSVIEKQCELINKVLEKENS